MSRRDFWLTLFALVSITLSTHASPPVQDDKWWLARNVESGKEVLYRVRATLPDEATVARYSSLAVVDWVYSPKSDGMPEHDVAEQMYELEDLVEQEIEGRGMCALAFTRTGNGKKQWNYYVADTKAFQSALLTSIQSKRRFPIQVHFLPDASWDALREMHRAADK
jgi:hypothetical protein